MSAYVVQLIVQVGMMSARVHFAHRDVAKVPSKWAEECVVNTGGFQKEVTFFQVVSLTETISLLDCYHNFENSRSFQNCAGAL